MILICHLFKNNKKLRHKIFALFIQMRGTPARQKSKQVPLKKVIAK